MKFEIRNRLSGDVQFTASIDCAEGDTESIKMGLAALWAVENGADLSGACLSGANLSRSDLSRSDLSRANLSWSDLSRSDLSRANLTGANLSWSNLTGADLSRADLFGTDLSRADLFGTDLSRANLIAGGMRSDGYTFFAIREPDGAVKLRAGCHYFTLAEGVTYWQSTRGGTRLGDESIAMIEHLRRMAKIAGWL